MNPQPHMPPTHAHRSRPVPRPEVGAEAAENPRVLLCDPEPTGLERMLAAAVAEVVACASLEDALRAAASQRFDVAFLGMHEHSHATVGLLQLLRRAMPRTPIVLLLADASADAHRATLAMRPFYVAVPPVSPDELGTVFHNAVAAARRAS
jgi:DNA-binding NtrC family response regulator